MRHAAFLPIFGELAEPAVVAELAAVAEGAGWDGVVVWDHVTYRAPATDVADPWVTLAAMACATSRVTIGPMVTPLARRRPPTLARETVSVDRRSGGRLVLGVGLGGDGSREFDGLGDESDPRARARLLDEGLDVLLALWLRATNVDDDSLAQFHAVIRGVAEVYEDAGARGLYEPVLRQRHDVDDLLRGHHGPAHRAELRVVAGRLTVLLCHLSFDLSSETLADAYSAEARTIGDLCGDYGLRAYARSAQSFRAYYRGDYLDAAAYAADAARYAGSRPEAVQAAVHQARAHARLGDRDAVDSAVGRAFELRSSLNEPHAPHPFLAFEPYETARIAGNAATAYLSLGATDRVVEYTDAALPALAACGSRAGQASPDSTRPPRVSSVTHRTPSAPPTRSPKPSLRPEGSVRR